jgi:hypothetical protein
MTMSRTIAASLAFAALTLLSGCDSDDTSGPSTPPAPVPSVAGTYPSTQWLVQFNRTHDGYHGSWMCAGSMTLVQEPGSDKFSGFAVVGAPCKAVSFDLTGSVTSGGALTIVTSGPASNAGPCPQPPPSAYSGLYQGNQVSARSQVKVQCAEEGEYVFDQILTAYKR